MLEAKMICRPAQQVEIQSVITTPHVLPRPLPTSFAFKGHSLKYIYIYTHIYYKNKREYIVKEKKQNNC